MTPEERVRLSLSHFGRVLTSPDGKRIEVDLDAVHRLVDFEVARVREEEREACTKIAEQDSRLDWIGGSTGNAKGTARLIAAAIRGRATVGEGGNEGMSERGMKFVQISAGPDYQDKPTVYALGDDGRVYVWVAASPTGSYWEALPGDVRDFSGGAHD